MNNYGLVSRIQHFSTDDGDGIRTTVFLQGCGLFCKWCHNPETLSPRGNLLIFDSRCTGCGLCEKICPTGAHRLDPEHRFFRESCILCGKCARICPEKAIEWSGVRMSVSQVLEEILEDADFYGETGGVTVSGGEPLRQADFVAELARKCRENGVRVAVDTAVSVAFSEIEKVLPYTDLFLADFKAASPEKMRQMTGADYRQVLGNIQKLMERSRVLVRIPVIPGYNDSAEDMENAGAVLRGARVQLLPFHRLATSKYQALGLVYAFADCTPPTVEKMNEMKEILKNKGVDVI